MSNFSWSINFPTFSFIGTTFNTLGCTDPSRIISRLTHDVEWLMCSVLNSSIDAFHMVWELRPFGAQFSIWLPQCLVRPRMGIMPSVEPSFLVGRDLMRPTCLVLWSWSDIACLLISSRVTINEIMKPVRFFLGLLELIVKIYGSTIL